MRIVEPLANAADDKHRQRDRHLLFVLRQMFVNLGQILALDKLHGNEVVVILLAKFVYLDDTRMVEGRCNTGLIDKHGNEFLVLGHVRQDFLDHQEAFESCGAEGLGQVNLGHAAYCQLLEQMILAKWCR